MSTSIRGKTLVTGAAGFIGSNVTRLLLEEGREVRALVLPGENTRNIDGLDVEIVEGDLTDPDSLKGVVKGCSRLYHLAAIYADWLPRPEKMFEVNCIGSLNILWEALRAEVEKVVYTSSVVAIGPAGAGLGDEGMPFDAWTTGMDYARSKWLSEQEARTFCRNGLDIRFCCPGMPYGAGDIGPTPTGRLLLMAAKGLPPFLPDNDMSVVDVADVARGHLLAEEKGKNGERYILTNENIRLSQFVDTVADVVGRETRRYTVPAGATAILAPVADLIERRAHRTGKAPFITAGALRYSRLNFRFSNEKARRELGMEFTPMRTAICKALDWFIREGRIKDQQFISDFSRHGACELAEQATA